MWAPASQISGAFSEAPKGVCVSQDVCLQKHGLLGVHFMCTLSAQSLTEKKQMPTALLFSLIGYEPLRPLQPFHFCT